MGRITVTGLGKAYKSYPSQWARLAEWLLPFAAPRHTLKWVLQEVNFEVQPGQALGIIGINGAGKSTLLKLITGTTQATTGSVHSSGRVAALLELGLGFHPEFTGRQNVYMAGQLLGYTPNDIRALMPAIESFAEIGDYIDQPVRMYSSGMQVRLAFSVATARRPDILIVDEALSVGDSYFQHKSFERIRAYRQQGTTLLIVSHDKQVIQSVCDHAVLLNAGRIAMQGPPEAVMDYYNALLASHQNQQVAQTAGANGRIQTISGTGEATVVSVALRNANGDQVETIDVGQRVTLHVQVQAHAPLERLVFGYGIKDRLGQVIYGTNTGLKNQALVHVRAGDQFCFDIAFDANLGVGSYSIQTALTGGQTHLDGNFQWCDLALVFTVVNTQKPHFEGCAWIDPVIKVRPL